MAAEEKETDRCRKKEKEKEKKRTEREGEATYPNIRQQCCAQVKNACLQAGLAFAAVVAQLPAKSNFRFWAKKFAHGHGEDKCLAMQKEE